MFLGRDAELKRLNTLYESKKFECVVLHGRQRIGKTTLIREFIKNKNAIYFSSQETCIIENRQNLINLVKAFDKDSAIDIKNNFDFDEIFEHIYKLARSQRVILIIDDYQLFAQGKRGITDLICNHINKHLRYSRLMLIISGSSEPVMEKEVLSLDSPFYGWRTAQIKLLPFTFEEFRRYYSSYPLFDATIIYGMTGGVPKYINMMSSDLPIEDNIRRAFLNSDSFLLEEPINILRRVVRDPTYYNAVLKAIGSGNDKNSEIASAVGLDTAACTAYLKNLIAMDIVEKHTPLLEKIGKKTIYEIEDSFFRFWYCFIPDNISQIRIGAVSKIWRDIARTIPMYMYKTFLAICRQWLSEQNSLGQLCFNAVEFGRWWGTIPVGNGSPNSKEIVSIPIVAYSDDDNVLFADGKWSEEPIDTEALESLIYRSRMFNYKNKFYYLFSCSGFTSDCIDLAEKHEVYLIELH